MRKILFLHPNFPGQFKYVAEYFASNGLEVTFLCQTHYGRTIKGVKRIAIKQPEKIDDKKSNHKLPPAFHMANEYYNAMEILSKNYTPDLIISHSGFGCGLHSKQVWPKSKTIAYSEWWFTGNSDIFTYGAPNNYMGFTRQSIKKFHARNTTFALELIEADLIITPTEWQLDQLPKSLQATAKVIHDGIDIEGLKKLSILRSKKNYKSLKEADFIITYGTRGMEPVRGFPQFIKELPAVFEEYSNATVKIVGEDEIFYGGLKPRGFKSWKTWALKYLKSKNIGNDKVKWLGRLGREEYEKWLVESDVHVYLSHPFVPSWSYLEAQASGCNIIATEHRSITENTISDRVTFVHHNENGFLLRALKENHEKMSNKNEIGTNLESRYLLDNFRKYDKKVCCSAWAAVTGVDVATMA